MAEIAVIVVNYNAGELALAAVESVLAHTHPGHDVHVHLVDNASPNGDGAMLAEVAAARGWGARVTLHLERVNHGFGRGNNLVLEELARCAMPPDYVFLLNPDAQLEGETIATLANFLAAHPKAAVAGARARNPGREAPVTAAFQFPSAWSVLSSAINFGPVARVLDRHRVALDPDLPTQRVDWVSGAAVMARFDVWRELGFFDPEYFLYYEEVDLMLRTARTGWECWHVAEARIVHVEGASTDVKSVATERKRHPAYLYHSWQHYFRKNHGRGYALLSAAAWTGGAIVNHLLVRLRGQRPAAPKRFFEDFWAEGWRPLLGLAPGRR
ncbi:glycosyltransferase family 2 protein [uncultured Jannaschia sp.]|uniref:glycosyltransferase family 2 protein n=1 Tax=uncultured Jannaschia sp. TaxID=293347 RepID=UPI00262C7B1B|nr:glycosyltransferase family 2 protein [uncultured Jannaschia sp.]